MEKLLTTEQALSKDQMECGCCFLGLLNYSIVQTPHVWVSGDLGPRQELVLLCESR